MSEEMVRKIADGADMIVRGYAFTRADDFIRIFNLNDRESSMVIAPDGTMIETNMNEIEQALVLDIWSKDSKYIFVYILLSFFLETAQKSLCIF